MVLMVVGYFHVVRALVPPEAHPPLVVNAYRMLPCAISVKNFEPVSRRHPQVVQKLGRINQRQFLERPPQDVGRKLIRFLGSEELLGLLVREASNHAEYITENYALRKAESIVTKSSAMQVEQTQTVANCC
jgi:hypothetical protein